MLRVPRKFFSFPTPSVFVDLKLNENEEMVLSMMYIFCLSLDPFQEGGTHYNNNTPAWNWMKSLNSFLLPISCLVCADEARRTPDSNIFLLSHFSWGRARSHQEGSFLHNSREKAEKKKLDSEQGEEIFARKERFLGREPK